jgi:hypothetical protein
MLFKILKLFGLDVRAEIATVKGQIEQHVEELAVRAKPAGRHERSLRLNDLAPLLLRYIVRHDSPQ